MYREYNLDRLKERARPDEMQTFVEFLKESQAPVVDAVLDNAQRLDSLPSSHDARKFAAQRRLPVKALQLLYYVDEFKKFTNTALPNKFTDIYKDHPRIIIPYLNRHGKCFAFQGRSLDNREPRYFSIKLDSSEEMIYGLERVKFNRPIYVVEGPFDSLFLPNCIAVSGSSFMGPTLDRIKSHAVLVYDNEPRAAEITKLMGRSIGKGYKVCLWPSSIQPKDINNMVLAGYPPKQILDIINNNTYQGIEAQARFAMWRKAK